MKVAAVKAPGGLDKLVIESRAEPVAGPGQILVRVFASSLNFHDLAVVSGRIKTADGRIPMSDGAGEVVAVGEGVGTFKKGDHVLSTFFPNWISGGPTRERLMGVPGDGADGFAAEYVAMSSRDLHPPAQGVELCPGGDVALRRAHRVARVDGRGADQAGRRRADPGHRRRVDLCRSIRQGRRRDRYRHVVVG